MKLSIYFDTGVVIKFVRTDNIILHYDYAVVAEHLKLYEDENKMEQCPILTIDDFTDDDFGIKAKADDSDDISDITNQTPKFNDNT